MRHRAATHAWVAGLALLASAPACDRHGTSASGSGGSVALPPGATPVPVTETPPAIPPAPVLTPPASSIAGFVPPSSFAPIARVADPSVVLITTVGVEEEISPFTHRRRRAETKGLGTGFVIDTHGTVLTNNHVVNNASAVEVRLSDQRSFEGKVVATDPPTDIAVVHIDAKDLRALPLGDSDAIEVGDWAVAIGNPFGLSHSVSAGIISARGRTKDDVPLDPAGFYDFLQTDASINPGNSGGPLLNLRGEVVGINSAIRGGGAQGIGFAIPINMVKQLLPMLLRDGHLTRSALSVRIKDMRELTRDERQAIGLGEADALRGAVLEYVDPGGPADKAGLQPGDVIVSFEGTAIDKATRLQWLASTTGVGRTVTVRVQREGKQFDQKVTLGQLPTLPPAAGGR
ncbi:MAG TPA: trypsin-like peptidase domain-containing protein [Polyangiaceae bacterium]|jgi:serine protease Do